MLQPGAGRPLPLGPACVLGTVHDLLSAARTRPVLACPGGVGSQVTNRCRQPPHSLCLAAWPADVAPSKFLEDEVEPACYCLSQNSELDVVPADGTHEQECLTLELAVVP